MIGSDVAENYLAYLRMEGKRNVMMAEADHFPIGDRSTDAVLAVFGIDNLSNTRKFFNETYRVLKPGGVIVVADPGMSWWETDVMLYDILVHATDPYVIQWRESLIRGNRFNVLIPKFLTLYDINSYFDEVAQSKVGFSRRSAELYIELLAKHVASSSEQRLSHKEARSLGEMWNTYVNSNYFQTADHFAYLSGLITERSGKLCAWVEDGQWKVSAIYRNSRGVTWTNHAGFDFAKDENFPEAKPALSSPNRISVPVVVYLK